MRINLLKQHAYFGYNLSIPTIQPPISRGIGVDNGEHQKTFWETVVRIRPLGSPTATRPEPTNGSSATEPRSLLPQAPHRCAAVPAHLPIRRARARNPSGGDLHPRLWRPGRLSAIAGTGDRGQLPRSRAATPGGGSTQPAGHGTHRWAGPPLPREAARANQKSMT